MISIVIPVFNEEAVLARLYDRITAAGAHWGHDYEVITVDDGSRDRSAEILGGICQRDPRWKYLGFSRNFGHQAAVSAGLYYSRGDAVVVIDADLQDPPEELGRFLAKWEEGYHVVYAIRTRRKENILKRAAYASFYRLLRRVASIEIPLDSGDFCVMDRAVVDVLRTMRERSPFVRGLRSWAGFRQIGLAYERQARQAGDVKYTFTKLVKLAADGILSFSSTPLKLSSYLGFGLCGLAISIAALLIVWRLTNISIAGMSPGQAVGWTSLCSLVLLLSGLQFVVMGIMGEYLARVFDEVKARPPWIISEAHGVTVSGRTPAVGWYVPVPHDDRLSIRLPTSRVG